MAASVLRKLAVQTLRLNVVKSNFRCLRPTYKRNIHTSYSFQQLYFSEKHEWIDVPEGSNLGTVGITEYAQDALGDVVYIELPKVDDELEADGEAGVLESVKAASDIYSPVTGTVTAVNTDLEEHPEFVNKSPFEKGWLFKLTIANPADLDSLMDEANYNEFLTSLG